MWDKLIQLSNFTCLFTGRNIIYILFLQRTIPRVRRCRTLNPFLSLHLHDDMWLCSQNCIWVIVFYAGSFIFHLFLRELGKKVMNIILDGNSVENEPESHKAISALLDLGHNELHSYWVTHLTKQIIKQHKVLYCANLMIVAALNVCLDALRINEIFTVNKLNILTIKFIN